MSSTSARLGDHVVDIVAIVTIGAMAILDVIGYEPYAVVASIALGKRWFDLRKGTSP